MAKAAKPKTPKAKNTQPRKAPKKHQTVEQQQAAERRKSSFLTGANLKMFKRINFVKAMGKDTLTMLSNSTDAEIANIVRYLWYYLILNKKHTVTPDAVREAYRTATGNDIIGVPLKKKRRQKKVAAAE
ncbi:MAG: hypothetical protein JSS82_14020 [Bacteroidetes bacterium]|nr:hypothetical protein [Bacteroidota bacterium]